ncbi:hypothetical protein [Spiroplasma endosymbiont of Polydrusus cervinus]|uniref:hypothetical protein n=1 Tax=Spiroplasma endosymbiont of Polydrusus cervinus TaxID=3066287 RepID=UPI0030CD2063
MRKLLSIFTASVLCLTSVSSLVACSKTPEGSPVSVFIYNGNQKFSHAPTATNKSTNGIDDATKSGKDETDAPFEYSLQGGRMGLVNNVLNPFLHGINLTKDNSVTTGKGTKWSDEQVATGLQGQKDNLIAKAKSDTADPLDSSKKINQKKIWEAFYNDYSTSYDSTYVQVALLANENQAIQDSTNKNLVTTTGNPEKTNEKDWVKEHTWPTISKKGFFTPPSLKTFSPVASIIKWLNNPKNGYNEGYDKIEQNRGYQSTRYVAIVIPNVAIRLEFQGEHHRFTFTATIDKLVVYANYLVYLNPNSKNDEATYGHQWFFLSYDFYDFDDLKDDYYHRYNLSDIPNDVKINPDIQVALGFVKKGDEKGTLTADEDKEVGKNGQFLTQTSDYTFPALKWKINVDSITNQYK